MNNQTISNSFLIDTIARMPGYIFWKDKNSRLMGGNANFARIAGQTTKSIIGKTDYDLPWKRHETEAYRRADSEVVETGKAKLNIEESMHQADGKEKVLLTSKIPLRNASDKVVGSIGIFVEITNLKNQLSRVEFQTDILNVIKQDLLNSLSSFMKIADILHNKNIDFDRFTCLNNMLEHSYSLLSYVNNMRKFTDKSVPIREEISSIVSTDYYLTKRELQCLQYLVYGKTAKGTANLLNISAKTVESYINKVKEKTGCYTRSQLVEFALKANLVDFYRLRNY